MQKRDAEALLREVKAVAENIPGTNWIEKKAALLALVNVSAEDGQTAEG